MCEFPLLSTVDFEMKMACTFSRALRRRNRHPGFVSTYTRQRDSQAGAKCDECVWREVNTRTACDEGVTGGVGGGGHGVKVVRRVHIIIQEI